MHDIEYCNQDSLRYIQNLHHFQRKYLHVLGFHTILLRRHHYRHPILNKLHFVLYQVDIQNIGFHNIYWLYFDHNNTFQESHLNRLLLHQKRLLLHYGKNQLLPPPPTIILDFKPSKLSHAPEINLISVAPPPAPALIPVPSLATPLPPPL